jgi:arginase family enzyme
MAPASLINIVIPSDSASRVAGASKSGRHWHNIVKAHNENAETIFYSREKGELLPRLLEFEVGKAIHKHSLPLTLGGDHALTYSILKPLTAKHGSLTVVHFDAHHDAYPGPMLNHYNVFDVCTRRLPVTMVGIGYRHDSEPLPSRLASPVRGKIYISLDVDYFAPHLVPSVGHAVDCDSTQTCDFDDFAESLEFIEGEIVGADIVEWLGPATDRETDFITRVYSRLVERLKRC